MALSPRLELRQGQSLVMTPQLQQAIKLLQLSNLEVTAFVEQELERNPLLERAEVEGSAEAEANTDPGEAASPSDANDTAIDLGDGGSAAAAQSLDAENDSTFTNDDASDLSGSNNYIEGRGGASNFGEDGNDFEQATAEGVTLRDHLLAQLHIEIPEGPARIIGTQLIEALDDTGYLTEPLADVAARLGAAEGDVTRVLERLQQFEPSGVFARSLAECIKLQLRELDRLDPAMEALVDNLELVAKRDFNELQRRCGVDAEDIADMVRELRALNPKPGLAFSGEVTQTVLPDVFVRRLPDGTWHVELNADTLPRLLVNTRYHARVNTEARSKADKGYLTEQLAAANWLIKSLDQRANTILKVASEIVRQQENFFLFGVQHLRPLNLKTVAEAISMHESTVSRVTANKYLSCPRGLFELKYFFTAAISGTDGAAAHSAEAVRQRIKTLIDAEKPDDILSDDQLVEMLKSDGIDIARRTVAKYRESLKIASSVQRRRQKASAI